MMSAGMDAAAEQAANPCHEAVPDVPDCCDDMNGAACGMDCGTASSAVSSSLALSGPSGHGAWSPGAIYAAPDHPPESLFKPPRIS
jgi:hypothetical protein